MALELFDPELRALRRDRAFRQGPELFLAERAFTDCLERLATVNRRFRSALLIGSPDASWPGRLAAIVDRVDVTDPGPRLAEAAGGTCIVEDRADLPAASYDLCLALGTFDTVNDLPSSLRILRAAMVPDGLLMGISAGANNLPRLRGAMHAADQVMGASVPHVHPRIEASSLASLLSAAGFIMPVVDLDRIQVAYSGLSVLVDDLRRMAGTNVMHARSRVPLSREALAAAKAAFRGTETGKVIEVFELVHFAAWTPPEPPEERTRLSRR